MGNLRVCVAALLLVPVVACGGDSATPDAAKSIDAPKTIDAPKAIDAAPTPDAQHFDFSCAGSAAGSPAANITISGKIQALSFSGTTPLKASTLKLFKNGNDQALATLDIAAGSDGTFSFPPQPTNGSALDGSVRLSSVGSGVYRDDIVIPAHPLVADQANVPVLAVSDSDFGSLASVAGSSQTASNGAVILLITDCARTPIAGATVTLKQGNTPLEVIDASTTPLSSQAAGAYFAFNVTPGDVTLDVTVGGHTFPTRTLTVVTDTTTTTQVAP